MISESQTRLGDWRDRHSVEIEHFASGALNNKVTRLPAAG